MRTHSKNLIAMVFAVCIGAPQILQAQEGNEPVFDAQKNISDGVVAKFDLSHPESQILRQVSELPAGATINQMAMALPAHYGDIGRNIEEEKSSTEESDAKDQANPKNKNGEVPEKLKPKFKGGYQASLENIYPMIVPNWYFDGDKFPALSVKLIDSRFRLTWVEYNDGAMTYIQQKDVDGFEADEINWKRQAMENLASATPEDYGVTIPVQAGEETPVETWALLSRGDPIASSRVLLTERMKKFSPDGYEIVICSRDVAIVVPSTATEKQKSEVERQAMQIFETRWKINEWPMSSELLPANSVEFDTKDEEIENDDGGGQDESLE
jgi:hypothetical protein